MKIASAATPLAVCLGTLTLVSVTAFAKPEAAASKPDARHVRNEWERFAQEPHPMGSKAQFAYSEHIKSALSRAGLVARFQSFEAPAPNRKAEGLGGKEKAAAKTTPEKGRNVLGVRKGPDSCALLLAGHYDTKEFLGEKFVGANDGGSSTVLLLELARTTAKAKPAPGTYGACDVHFVFFDGEEAFLKDWNDGERLAGVRDHLYGSNAFVASELESRTDSSGAKTNVVSGKPVALLALFDMVGHAKQTIFLTQGSNEAAVAAFLAVKGAVNAKAVPLGIEDDHMPFALRGVPFLHAIDWTNLAEWHTPKDDLSIVSAEKIVLLAEAVQRFLAQKRPKP